jgi:predicted RNA-binding protein with PIN domain
MIVDGCNVALGREASGALADRRKDLLNALDAHRSRYGTRVVVIFDGDAHAAGGGRNTRIRIVFTEADVIADDLIVEEVLELPDDQAVVVVTDDQGLRSRLRPLGADVVGVGAMWSLLRS